MDIKLSPSPRNNKGPDFIGLGVMKAATTWIYTCLYEHPQVYAPLKELNFFNDDKLWSKGKGWYEKIFKNAPPGTKKGEFSVFYLADPQTPQRIKSLYPQVKLITSLRNPIDRAFSHYLHSIRIGNLNPNVSFEDAINMQEKYLNVSKYGEQLERYLQYFPQEQLLIVIYEDIAQDPLRFIQAIYKFIGVNDQFIPRQTLNQKINTKHLAKSIFLSKLMLRTSNFLRAKGMHKLWWLMRNSLGYRLEKINAKEINIEISPKLRKQLLDYFRPDIKKTEKITGRNLDLIWSANE